MKEGRVRAGEEVADEVRWFFFFGDSRLWCGGERL